MDFRLLLFGFQLATVSYTDSNQQDYFLKGFNQDAACRTLKNLHQSNPKRFFEKKWTFNDLLYLDRQSIGEIFKLDRLEYKVKNDAYCEFVRTLLTSLIEDTNCDINALIKNYEQFLSNNPNILYTLIEQFEMCNSPGSIKYVVEIINSLSDKFKNQSLKAVSKIHAIDFFLREQKNIQVAETKIQKLNNLIQMQSIQKKGESFLPQNYQCRYQILQAIIKIEHGHFALALKDLDQAKDLCKDKLYVMWIFECKALAYEI